MSTGIKKLQRVQFGKEVTAGTAVASTAIWRGTGNQLDDQRKVNKVAENIGVLTDTTRTNISQLMGMISLNSCNATYEQLPLLFAMAFGGPTVGAIDGGTGTGGVLTANLTAGVVTSVTVNAGGSAYASPPTLLFYGGSPTTGPATGTAAVSAGAITTITVVGGGTGYVIAPKILVIPAGAGSDGVYQTTFPTTVAPLAANTTFTIIGGDNFETEQMEFAVCTKIELSGDAGGEVKVSGDIMGRQVTYYATGFSAVSSFPNPIEDILFQKGKVYLDAVGGSFGSTQVSNTIKSFKLTFDVKWHPEFTVDNILYYTTANFTEWTAKGELVYLHDTTVSGTGGGAKTFYRTQTPKLLRLDFTGGALATPGTTYSTKRCIIDIPLQMVNTGPLGDKEGVSTVTVNFDGGYDPTAGVAGKIIIVSDQRVLTGVTV